MVYPQLGGFPFADYHNLGGIWDLMDNLCASFRVPSVQQHQGHSALEGGYNPCCWTNTRCWKAVKALYDLVMVPWAAAPTLSSSVESIEILVFGKYVITLFHQKSRPAQQHTMILTTLAPCLRHGQEISDQKSEPWLQNKTMQRERSCASFLGRRPIPFRKTLLHGFSLVEKKWLVAQQVLTFCILM